MKILITGGAGFIGSHLAASLHDRHEVVLLDNLSNGKPENLQGLTKSIPLIVGDIRDEKAVERAMKGVNTVFHLAAFTSVAESFQNPKECFDVNVNGLINVAKEAERNNARFIFTSTSAVYNQDTHEDCAFPQNPYGITKFAGEQLLNLYRIHHEIYRLFNVYGHRQSLHYAAVIPTFINAALNNEPLYVHGNGSQTRDFIHVSDVVRILTSNLPGPVNVGTGIATSVLDLAHTIIKKTGSKSEIKYIPAIQGLMHSRAHTGKLSLYTGKMPMLVKDGLDLML